LDRGIGLYFSKEIITMFGGTLTLHRNVPQAEATTSSPQGATFRIALPVIPKS